MSLEYDFILIGNEAAGVAKIQKNLGVFLEFREVNILSIPLEARYYTEEERRDIEKSIPRGVPLIHVERHYGDSLAELIADRRYSVNECHNFIKFFYEHDRCLLTLRCLAEKSLLLDWVDIEDKLPELAAFLGKKISRQKFLYCLSQLTEHSKLESPFLKVLKYQAIKKIIEEYEKLRSFSHHLFYLSPVARAVFLKNEGSQAPLKIYDKELEEVNKSSIIFLDIKPSCRFLDNYLGQDVIPNTAVIIFSFAKVIEEVLSEARYTRFLDQGTLKILHLSEWKSSFDKYYENIRFPLYFCKSLIVAQNHPEGKKVAAYVQEKRGQYLKGAETHKREVLRYYGGSSFKQRLEKILKGLQIKVYIERACCSIAVKHFSDACARAFKKIGCDVYMHNPCEDGSIDFFHTLSYELNVFRPDILVRSPNMINNMRVNEGESLPPTLYSLQDIAPHIDFIGDLTKYPLKKEDLLFYLMHSFKDYYLKNGVSEQQQMLSPLPVDIPCLDLERFPVQEEYDVGFVKTMPKSLSLLDMIGEKSEGEEKEIADLEKTILWNIEQEFSVSLQSLLKSGKSRSWQEAILTYNHSATCVYLLEALRKSDCSLALYGAHWDRVDGFEKYAKGHLAHREDYYRHFLKNRINLSMNSLGEHQSRIFEGALHGAFFLIYRVPENANEIQLSKQLKAGEHFDYFSDKKELMEKVEYYIKRPDLRKKMGKRLQEEVLKNHSYEAFCRNIIHKMKDVIRISMKEGTGKGGKI